MTNARINESIKVFVAGAAGQLGCDYMDILPGRHDRRGMDLPELDITDAASIERCLGGWPDVIVNCAAYTNVDGCESDRDAAWAVNAEGPRLLSEYAAVHGVFLVHVSTDYVFDGLKPVPDTYREDEPTAPASVYGKSKLAGEAAIRNSGCESAIVRTSWLYGIHGKNFLKTMLRLALSKPEATIRVVDDQHGCPTWSYRLAEQIQRIIETKTTGILHASGEGFCTWHELASRFLEAMNVQHRLSPCATLEYPTPAKRPMNSILENSRLASAGINIMKNWEEDIDEFVAKHHDQLIREAGETIIR